MIHISHLRTGSVKSWVILDFDISNRYVSLLYGTIRPLEFSPSVSVTPLQNGPAEAQAGGRIVTLTRPMVPSQAAKVIPENSCPTTVRGLSIMPCTP
jgi:hypothetical protein